MAGNFLLDTGIVLAWIDGESSVAERVSEENVLLYIPAIVAGELYYGASQIENTEDRENTLAVLREFILPEVNGNIFLCDGETAYYYADIKRELREAGHKIPENDIWVAAITKQYQEYDLILVSRDAHFKLIPDLHLETW